jgi:hypothetical protein
MRPDCAPSAETRTLRVCCAALCAGLVALPFLWVRFPPITDLPQQVAQIRLLGDAWAQPHGPYRIQWFTPYTLSYVVLSVAWVVCRPENAGRLAMLAIGVLWTAATHWLGAKRRRPVAAAALASVLFFSHVMYWGFYSFVIGWPAFVLWFVLTVRPASPRRWWVEAASFGAAALLLYVSHALWLAAGIGWLAVYTLAFRVPLRTTLSRAAGVAPVCVAAAFWYPHLKAEGFVSPTRWATTPTARLSFSWLVDAAFGGIHGSMEYVVAFVLAGWVVVSVWQHRQRRTDAYDHALLLGAAMFAAAALLLPHLYQRTIEFDSRWLPMAVILLLLAVPAPVFDVGVERIGALALAAVFSLATTATWLSYDRIELSGLQRTLDALPAAPRVLGLDYVRHSALIKGRPFLQTFAYAQVVHGGELNFSFAEFAPSLVVYRHRRPIRWTQGLEWYAERVQPSDFSAFDYVIVNGGARQQRAMAALPMLTPVTGAGRWRLYRVKRPS